MKMSECNNGRGGGSVKPYIIIKGGGGLANPYGSLERGGGGSKIRKIALRNL